MLLAIYNYQIGFAISESESWSNEIEKKNAIRMFSAGLTIYLKSSSLYLWANNDSSTSAEDLPSPETISA